MYEERKSTFNRDGASDRSMKNAVDFHSDRSRNFREFSDLTGRYAPPSRSTGYELYRKRGEREEISCNHYDDTERSYGGSIRSSQCGRYGDDLNFPRSIDQSRYRDCSPRYGPNRYERRDRSQRTVSDKSPIKHRREVDDAFSLEASHRKSNATLPESFSFDGRGNWQTFITKFTTFAEGQRWTSRDRKNNIFWCFEGKASEYYSRLVKRDPQIDYFEILRKMEMWFNLCDISESVQVYFAQAVQSPNENLIEWADRVFNMASIAYPDVSDNEIAKHAIFKFCQRCTDKAAGQYSINLRPLTMEAAIDNIHWYQHTDRVKYVQSKREDLEDSNGESSLKENASMVARAFVPKIECVQRVMRDHRTGRESSHKIYEKERLQDSMYQKMDDKMSTLEHVDTKVQQTDNCMMQFASEFSKLTKAVKREKLSSQYNKSKVDCESCDEYGHYSSDRPHKQHDTNKVANVSDDNDETDVNELASLLAHETEGPQESELQGMTDGLSSILRGDTVEVDCGSDHALLTELESVKIHQLRSDSMLKVPIGVENILLKAVVDSAAQVTIISDVREEEQESALTSAPMLPLPNSTDPSVLVTDADLNEEQGGDPQPPGEIRSKSSERPRSPGNYSVLRRQHNDKRHQVSTIHALLSAGESGSPLHRRDRNQREHSWDRCPGRQDSKYRSRSSNPYLDRSWESCRPYRQYIAGTSPRQTVSTPERVTRATQTEIQTMSKNRPDTQPTQTETLRRVSQSTQTKVLPTPGPVDVVVTQSAWRRAPQVMDGVSNSCEIPPNRPVACGRRQPRLRELAGPLTSWNSTSPQTIPKTIGVTAKRHAPLNTNRNSLSLQTIPKTVAARQMPAPVKAAAPIKTLIVTSTKRRAEFPTETLDLLPKRVTKKRCPISGCGRDCNAVNLKRHVQNCHIPALFHDKETRGMLDTERFHNRRLMGIRYLAESIIGPRATVEDLLSYTNQHLRLDPLTTVMPSTEEAMSELCRIAGWPMMTQYTLQQFNSPACLIYWRVMGYLMSCLSEQGRDVMHHKFGQEWRGQSRRQRRARPNNYRRQLQDTPLPAVPNVWEVVTPELDSLPRIQHSTPLPLVREVVSPELDAPPPEFNTPLHCLWFGKW